MTPYVSASNDIFSYIYTKLCAPRIKHFDRITQTEYPSLRLRRGRIAYTKLIIFCLERGLSIFYYRCRSWIFHFSHLPLPQQMCMKERKCSAKNSENYLLRSSVKISLNGIQPVVSFWLLHFRLALCIIFRHEIVHFCSNVSIVCGSSRSIVRYNYTS